PARPVPSLSSTSCRPVCPQPAGPAGRPVHAGVTGGTGGACARHGASCSPSSFLLPIGIPSHSRIDFCPENLKVRFDALPQQIRKRRLLFKEPSPALFVDGSRTNTATAATFRLRDFASLAETPRCARCGLRRAADRRGSASPATRSWPRPTTRAAALAQGP